MYTSLSIYAQYQVCVCLSARSYPFVCRAPRRFPRPLSAALVTAQVNIFYVSKEAELCRALSRLEPLLVHPSSWVLERVDASEFAKDASLGALLPKLVGGRHVAGERLKALISFVRLCHEIDLLRRFSVLNYIAVHKLLKKHDQLSQMKLYEGVSSFLQVQTFVSSSGLGNTFAAANALSSDILASAVARSPEVAMAGPACAHAAPGDANVGMCNSNGGVCKGEEGVCTSNGEVCTGGGICTGGGVGDTSAAPSGSACRMGGPSCCLCGELLQLPVNLGCGHSLCYSCVVKTCFYDQHCPVCNKETGLDFGSAIEDFASNFFSNNQQSANIVNGVFQLEEELSMPSVRFPAPANHVAYLSQCSPARPVPGRR